MSLVTSSELPKEIRLALEMPPIAHRNMVGGCEISWLSWGDPTARPLLFIPGGAAHAWWWSFTAPLLADRFHVVAIDLSGHGDSDRRHIYGFRRWAEEVRGIAGLQNSEQSPIIVGHSMGGVVASVLAANAAPGEFAGMISVDSPLKSLSAAESEETQVELMRRRSYASREEALASFRLVPRQSVQNAEIFNHIAERSVMPEVSGGRWTWKYDPAIFGRQEPDRPEDVGELLRVAACPIGVIVGEASEVLPATDVATLRELAAGSSRVGPFEYRSVVGGQHHLMFDKPRELITLIGELADSFAAL